MSGTRVEVIPIVTVAMGVGGGGGGVGELLNQIYRDDWKQAKMKNQKHPVTKINP